MNGLGPWWFPPNLRARITALAKPCFPSAPWEDHDFAYWQGGTASDKRKADITFLKALIADASSAKTCFYAITLYLFVVAFGRFSFRYLNNRKMAPHADIHQ